MRLCTVVYGSVSFQNCFSFVCVGFTDMANVALFVYMDHTKISTEEIGLCDVMTLHI
jgi:hypothetical protein